MRAKRAGQDQNFRLFLIRFLLSFPIEILENLECNRGYNALLNDAFRFRIGERASGILLLPFRLPRRKPGKLCPLPARFLPFSLIFSIQFFKIKYDDNIVSPPSFRKRVDLRSTKIFLVFANAPKSGKFLIAPSSIPLKGKSR